MVLRLHTTRAVIKAVAEGRKQIILARNRPVLVGNQIQLVGPREETLDVEIQEVARIRDDMLLRVVPVSGMGATPYHLTNDVGRPWDPAGLRGSECR